MNLLTINQIIDITGYSRRTIDKKPIEKHLAKKVITDGRPKNLYSETVLELFNCKSKDLSQNNIANNFKDLINGSNQNPINKYRSDKNSPKRPSGISLEERVKLEKYITEITKDFYLNQFDKFGLNVSVEDACKFYLSLFELPSGFNDLEDMIIYYYKRLTRKDTYYVGSYVDENWKVQWDMKNNKHKLMSSVPNKSYDYDRLFIESNLAGQGFGAGQMWSIDATQLDVWVDEIGKKRMKSFFQIQDVLTKFPLEIYPIESESAVSVIEAIVKAIEKYGIPSLGIILDNSSAFKSKQVQAFINLLYTKEQLEFCKNLEIFKRIFPKQGIVKYSTPMVPKTFGKGKIERSFEELNIRFTSQSSRGISRQSGTEKNKLAPQLGTVPTKQFKYAQDSEVVIIDFKEFVYTNYINRLRSDSFNYLKEIGIKPTIRASWQYYGGDKLMLNPTQVPEESLPILYFYKTSKHRIHRISVEKLGSFRLSENGRMLNYNTEADTLDFKMMGRKIAVIIDEDQYPKNAFCYLEYDKKRYDERVPEEGCIYFLGRAKYNNVSSISDFSLIEDRKKYQKQQENKLKQAKTISQETQLLLDSKPINTDYELLENIEYSKKYIDKNIINIQTNQIKSLNQNSKQIENTKYLSTNIEDDIDNKYDDNFEINIKPTTEINLDDININDLLDY